MFDATGARSAAPLETVQLPFPFELRTVSCGRLRAFRIVEVLLLSAPRGVRPDAFAFLEKTGSKESNM